MAIDALDLCAHCVLCVRQSSNQVSREGSEGGEGLAENRFVLRNLLGLRETSESVEIATNHFASRSGREDRRGMAIDGLKLCAHCSPSREAKNLTLKRNR